MIKIIEDNAREAVRRSYFANNFSSAALDTIADWIEESYDQITRDQIDEILMNADEYDSMKDAVESLGCADLYELRDGNTVVAIDTGKDERVVIVQ